MKIRILAMILAVVPISAVGVSATGTQDALPHGPHRLDPTSGEIDGESAVAVYPARFEGAKPVEILQPDGCIVRLRSAEDSEVHSRPCGEWFALPSSSYRFFVETEERISPHAELLVHRARTFDGAGRERAVPLGPAGRVALPTGVTAGEEEVFGVFQADSHARGRLHPPLSRRLAFAEVGEGVMMPAGLVVASVRDAEYGTLLRLSRPFEVAAGEAIAAPEGLPETGRAHLLAQVIRPERLQTAEQDSVTLRLVDGEERRPPDLRMPFEDSVFGIWYDLHPGTAKIVAEAHEASLERPMLIELEAGKIATVKGTLVGPTNTADLDVEVALPPPLWKDEVRLEIRLRAGEELVAERTLELYEQWLRFEDLPAGVLTVEIMTSLGNFAEFEDLQPGTEGFVRIAPEVIRIRGEVTSGGEPQRATVEFTTVMGDEIEAETDEEGVYELVTLEHLRWLHVQLADQETPPWVRLFGRPIAESRVLDIEIPSNRFEVAVADGLTGEPIEGVKVTALNEYPNDLDPERTLRAGASAKTGEDGVARLRPLQPGSLEVRAVADGYERMDEPLRTEIRPDDHERLLEIRLQPFGARATVQILLADGSPAEGAEVTLFDGTGGYAAKTSADAKGEVELPRSAAGAVAAVRHPYAGFLKTTWQPAEGDESETWVLPNAAPPLRLRVMDPWGEHFQRHADVALWVDGTFLSGRLLMALTGQKPMADMGGYWTVDNLPPGAVGVVAWKRGAVSAAVAKLPSMATTLTPPWPDLVEIRAVGE